MYQLFQIKVPGTMHLKLDELRARQEKQREELNKQLDELKKERRQFSQAERPSEKPAKSEFSQAERGHSVFRMLKRKET